MRPIQLTRVAEAGGVLPFDRTHVFNASYNYTFPKFAHGDLENKFTDAVLQWLADVRHHHVPNVVRQFGCRFSGDITQLVRRYAWFGSDAFNVQGQSVGAVTPQYLGNPSVSGGGKVGDKLFDLSQLKIPSFPNTGPSQPPFSSESSEPGNFDVSFFKNFNFSESKKFQFGTGFFNIFNQAYPTSNQPDRRVWVASDIYLTLNTVCKVHKEWRAEWNRRNRETMSAIPPVASTTIKPRRTILVRS